MSYKINDMFPVYRFKVTKENKKKGTVTGVYERGGLVAAGLILNHPEEEIKKILESSHGPMFRIIYPFGWTGPKPFAMPENSFLSIP